jgi:DNA-binding transcriptional LysR family regulator
MISVTLQQIDVFLAVAEHLNISEAANASFMSQSALSKTVTRLESGIGVKLLNRGNRGVTLTPEGQHLYNALKKPFGVMANAFNEVQDMQRTAARSIRISLPDSSDYNSDYNVVKQAIKLFTQTHPSVEVIETICETTQLNNALYFSEADIVVGQSFIIDEPPGVARMDIATLRTYFAIPANHPLAQNDELDARELMEETFYVASAGNSESLDRYAQLSWDALGFTPRNVRVVPNMATVVRMVGAGRGVSICGHIDSVATEIPIRCYQVTVHPELFQKTIVAAWVTENMTADKRDFLKTLRELAEQNRTKV